MRPVRDNLSRLKKATAKNYPQKETRSITSKIPIATMGIRHTPRIHSSSDIPSIRLTTSPGDFCISAEKRVEKQGSQTYYNLEGCAYCHLDLASKQGISSDKHPSYLIAGAGHHRDQLWDQECTR